MKEQKPGAKDRDAGDAEQKTDAGAQPGGGESPRAKWAVIVESATKWNAGHPDLVAEFNKLTAGKCAGNNAGVSVRAVRIWQMEHGLKHHDGKVGQASVQAARASAPKAEEGADSDSKGAGATGGGDDNSIDKKSAAAGGAHPAAKDKPKAEVVSFSEEEAEPVEADALKEVPADADVDAAKIVDGGDTSHNRNGKPKAEIEGEDVQEVADFIVETLDALGVPHIGKVNLVAKLMHAKNAQDVYKTLKDEITPSAVLEVAEKAGKRFGWKAIEEGAGKAVPFVAGAEVGLEFAVLSMKYIIGPANKEGREEGQLNRYASAWAFRFFDDGYAPEMLGEIDEQTQLMNTCSRLGVEDAVKTLAKLGDQTDATRKAAIKHYGGIPTARENLALELLKHAGVK